MSFGRNLPYMWVSVSLWSRLLLNPMTLIDILIPASLLWMSEVMPPPLWHPHGVLVSNRPAHPSTELTYSQADPTGSLFGATRLSISGQPHTLLDELWIIQSLSNFNDNAGGNRRPTTASSSRNELHSHMKRKRGCPRVKEVVLHIKRGVGRPRKKPLDSENNAPPLPKKKVGRPPKTKNSGGVVVDFGPIVSTYITSNIYNSFSCFFGIIGHPCFPKPASNKPSGNCGGNGHAAKTQAADTQTDSRHTASDPTAGESTATECAADSWMWFDEC